MQFLILDGKFKTRNVTEFDSTGVVDNTLSILHLHSYCVAVFLKIIYLYTSGVASSRVDAFIMKYVVEPVFASFLQGSTVSFFEN